MSVNESNFHLIKWLIVQSVNQPSVSQSINLLNCSNEWWSQSVGQSSNLQIFDLFNKFFIWVINQWSKTEYFQLQSILPSFQFAYKYFFITWLLLKYIFWAIALLCCKLLFLIFWLLLLVSLNEQWTTIEVTCCSHPTDSQLGNISI